MDGRETSVAAMLTSQKTSVASMLTSSLSKPDARYADCPGCVRNRVSTDPEHTREPGKCRAEHTPVVEWACEGCRTHRPAEHRSHTKVVGECRVPETRARIDAGRPPRGARVPTAQDESATMRPGPPAPDAVEEDEADALEGRTPTAGGAPSSSFTTLGCPCHRAQAAAWLSPSCIATQEGGGPRRW